MGSQALTVAQEKGLAALAADEKKRKATAITIVQDIKCSEFFKENWDVLLIAAPCAIKILGNLNAVAATKFAVQTKISQPRNGFKRLTTQPEGKNYLQGALADLSNQSENSFSIARTRMFSIIQDSEGVTQTVKMIMSSLKDPAAPFSEVLMSLSELTSAADSCKKHALEVQTSMGDFKDMAQELYTACKNESADIQTQQAKVQSKKELAEKEKQEREALEKTAKDHLTEMGKKMDDAQKTFKSTLDKMPTGMDLVGQQVLMGLGDAAGDALRIGTNVAANAAAASINPIGTTAGAIKDLKSISEEVTKQQKEDQKKAAAGKKKGEKETPNTEKKAEAEAEGIIAKLKKPFTRRSNPKKESEAGSKKGDDKEKKKEETASESAESTTKTPEAANPASRQTYGTWDLSGKFDAKDPALVVAVAIKAAIDVIKQAIVGSPNGVDWDSLKSPADAKDGTVIFNFALQILAKFSLFRDVAKMYNRVDQEAIKPGLELVNEVGSIAGKPGWTDDQLFEFRKTKMLNWCNDAEATVKAVVKEQQDSILKTLQTRINDIEQSIAVFPLEYQPDEKTSEAIEGGAALIRESNQKQIEYSQENSTVAQVMSSSELEFGEGEDDL
ncbi:hypothetical protein F5Y12DRAFT_789713 [Xylaria sp. FL1777]|nr:hypothetical protein F5Y12DRAFT_789713 [Xylaria sp. FL1777]